jgi:hypothetical protein
MVTKCYTTYPGTTANVGESCPGQKGQPCLGVLATVAIAETMVKLIGTDYILS